MRAKNKSTEEIRRGKTELLKCDIDTIIEEKKKKLNGFGIQLTDRTLARIYLLRKIKAPDIKIFEEMVEVARILKGYLSKTKGEQQQLFR